MSEMLETARLTLRPFTAGDRPLVRAIAADPDTTRYLYYWGRPGMTVEQDTDRFLNYALKGWQEQPIRDREYVLIKKEDGTAIGDGSIQYVDDEMGEIGWILLPEYRGHGYVTEMGQALLRFGFEELGFKRIIACCDIRNRASHHVMQRLNMHTLRIDIGARPKKTADDIAADERVCCITFEHWKQLLRG